MAWTKTLPDGDQSIGIGDDAIRDNNDQLEAALDLEHRFATGGNQTGRHKFFVGTPTQIDALTNAVEGSIAFDDDTLAADRPTLWVYDGSAWNTLDIDQAIGRLDEEGDWTAPQSTQWVSVAVGGGLLPINMNLSACKYATLPASSTTTIQGPSNAPTSGYSQSVILQLTNGGVDCVLAWDTQYRASQGVEPLFDASSGAVNYYFLTVMQTGAVLVTAVPNVGTF